MDTAISLDDKTELNPGEQQLTPAPQTHEGQDELSELQMEPNLQETNQNDVPMVDSLEDKGFTQVKPKPTPRLDCPPSYVGKGPSAHNRTHVVIWNCKLAVDLLAIKDGKIYNWIWACLKEFFVEAKKRDNTFAWCKYCPEEGEMDTICKAS